MNKSNSEANNSKMKKERRPPKKITENYLHNSGLYYLERFAASSAHFKKIMTRKIDKSCAHHAEQDRDHCIAMLDKLVEKFQSLGLLDDESYTRAMVQSLRRRGLSARMIYAKLQAKGLTRNIIEKVLIQYAQTLGDDAELVSALRLARRKKLGPYAADLSEEKKEKTLGSLARAGFSYNVCRKVLDMDKSELEQLSAAVEY